MKDGKTIDDRMFLVLTTLANLGEATTYEIYQEHRGERKNIGPVLTLASAYRSIDGLGDIGMVRVARTTPLLNHEGKMLGVPHYVVTDIGRLAIAIRHRKERDA